MTRGPRLSESPSDRPPERDVEDQLIVTGR